MEFIFWVILVIIDLYRIFKPAIKAAFKLAFDSIKNALPVSHTDRAPRKRQNLEREASVWDRMSFK